MIAVVNGQDPEMVAWMTATVLLVLAALAVWYLVDAVRWVRRWRLRRDSIAEWHDENAHLGEAVSRLDRLDGIDRRRPRGPR